jgi:hypothetical protein
MSLPESNAIERARGHREPPAGDDHTTPAHAAPSRTTLMTIRRVLHAYREGWLLEGRLAAAARMAAEDARQHGLTAERMLIALKREWTAMEEARRLPAIDAGNLLSALISLTIKAYYDPMGGERRAVSAAAPEGVPERRTAA